MNVKILHMEYFVLVLTVFRQSGLKISPFHRTNVPRAPLYRSLFAYLELRFVVVTSTPLFRSFLVSTMCCFYIKKYYLIIRFAWR